MLYFKHFKRILNKHWLLFFIIGVLAVAINAVTLAIIDAGIAIKVVLHRILPTNRYFVEQLDVYPLCAEY